MVVGSLKVKPIIKDTDPRMKEVSTPITEFDSDLHELVQDMMLAMMSHKGVGLSAVQIGITKRVIIVWDERVGNIIMVNPEFIRKGNRETVMTERCLSIDGFSRKVSRPAKCEVRWQNLEGEWETGNYSGLTARIIQHEMDHLEGITIKDKPEA